ncbi:podocalyxin-like protein 2-like [Arapaima gigas]
MSRAQCFGALTSREGLAGSLTQPGADYSDTQPRRRSHLPWLAFTGCLILLTSSDIVTQDLQLVPTSMEMPGLTQEEGASLSPDGPGALGFMVGSQESGFSSEENEDPKTLQLLYLWDEGGEVNGTTLDSETLESK